MVISWPKHTGALTNRYDWWILMVTLSVHVAHGEAVYQFEVSIYVLGCSIYACTDCAASCNVLETVYSTPSESNERHVFRILSIQFKVQDRTNWMFLSSYNTFNKSSIHLVRPVIRIHLFLHSVFQLHWVFSTKFNVKIFMTGE